MNLNQQLHDPALESYSRISDNPTKRSGNGFRDLGIAPGLIKEINRLKFEKPTPVQKEAIPVGIRGDDIIGIAQTGSGKTLAFGIPMLQHLSKSKRATGLIVVQQRELAIQVEASIQSISRSSKIRTVVLIGGASMSLQRTVLKKNPRIIIATPGRLMDHIERRTVNLTNVEVFILDEADRMLDMGFIPDIKKIMKSIPDERQTMLFSATMPKGIEAIAEKLTQNPTHIEVDRSGATPADISHEMFLIKNRDKSRLLAFQLNQCSGPVLVFTRTKRMASKLTDRVNNMGFAAAEIHSNRSLGQRRNALDGFKRGRFQILIATDIAARGIDVSGIELVVNYDMPANSEDYVHRIGRTGRAGKTGHAISFATTEQKGSIKSLERFMKTKLTVSALPALPSEKLLVAHAEQSRLESKPSRDEKPSRRQSSRDRSSKPKSSKSQRAQSSGFDRKDLKNEKPFWLHFKKKRSGKKKSVGQGSRRKGRAKRK